MSNEKLAQKLRELRKVNNYTQDYVAEVLGVVRQTYSHYETGKRTPDTNALYKLAGLYNISIDDLMHLTIDIDRNVSYDAPTPTQTSNDLAGFLEYFNDPAYLSFLNFLMILLIRKNICLTPILNVNYYSTLIRYPNRIRRRL